jgi:transposase-like protein
MIAEPGIYAVQTNIQQWNTNYCPLPLVQFKGRSWASSRRWHVYGTCNKTGGRWMFVECNRNRYV